LDFSVNSAGDVLISVENIPLNIGSAVITADRTLLITGRDNTTSDQLNVSYDTATAALQIFLNDQFFQFKLAAFDRVQANLLAGNDNVYINAPQLSGKPLTVDLGEGDENTASVTGVNATVFGGGGRDNVFETNCTVLFHGGDNLDQFGDYSDHAVTVDLRAMPDVEYAHITHGGTLIGNDLDNLLAGDNDFAVTLRGMGGNDTLAAVGPADMDGARATTRSTVACTATFSRGATATTPLIIPGAPEI